MVRESNRAKHIGTLLAINGSGQKHKVMNADFFWILMGAMIIIAIITQIATDKRLRRKRRHRKQK